MRILICDDNPVFGSVLEMQLEEYGRTRKEELQIVRVCAGREAVRRLKQEGYDVLFLDIEMPEQDGVETGRFIREELSNYGMEIIYISAKKGYAMELFKMNPFDFLLKPVSDQSLFGVMDRLMTALQAKGKIFTYRKKGQLVRRQIVDIFYFESLLKKTIIVTENGRDEFYASLKGVYEELRGKRFFYCHKSLLVNYQKVRDFHYDRLVMANGEVIEISQSKRKEVRQLISEWEMR